MDDQKKTQDFTKEIQAEDILVLQEDKYINAMENKQQKRGCT